MHRRRRRVSGHLGARPGRTAPRARGSAAVSAASSGHLCSRGSSHTCPRQGPPRIPRGSRRRGVACGAGAHPGGGRRCSRTPGCRRRPRGSRARAERGGRRRSRHRDLERSQVSCRRWGGGRARMRPAKSRRWRVKESGVSATADAGKAVHTELGWISNAPLAFKYRIVSRIVVDWGT